MTPRMMQTAGNDGSTRRFALTGPLAISLLALVVIGGVVLTAFAAVLTAAVGMGGEELQVAQDVDKSIEANRARMQKYQEQFNGRSVFFKPAAWPPQPVKHFEKPIEPIKPVVKEEPKIDPKYLGPGILYAIGDIVRFKAAAGSDKPLDIRVGEEKNGIRVISTHLPWHVRVGYRGGEYDVPIFTRGEDKFLLAQAKPIEIMPFLLEVPPAKPEIEVPKASGSPEDATIAKPAGDSGDNARGSARPERGRRGGARPETPRQPPARPAATPEEDGEDEEAADEAEAAADQEVIDQADDEAEADEEPQASPPGRRGAPPSTEDDDDEDEDTQRPARPGGRTSPPPQRNSGGSRPQPSPRTGQ